jgi:hypothetical protein
MDAIKALERTLLTGRNEKINHFPIPGEENRPPLRPVLANGLSVSMAFEA